MEQYPSISVIIPIRNEADFIERSLGAVLAQDCSTNHQVVESNKFRSRNERF